MQKYFFEFYATVHTCVQLAIFGQLQHEERMSCYLNVLLFLVKSQTGA